VFKVKLHKKHSQGANSFCCQDKQQTTMLNILFHICSRNDQLNKINIFLLVIFVEMSDKKKMLLLE
jgi:hypothetical protein